MKTNKTTLLLTGIIAAFVFILLFAALSLLGENDRVGAVVKELFTHIRQHEYAESYEHLCRDLQAHTFNNKEDFYEFCFLLHLSLLKKYDLLGENEYRIAVHRDHLWIPLLEDNDVSVSVLYRRNEPRTLLSILAGKHEEDFVQDLVTVVRERGSWKIRSINYTGSSIAGTFDELKQQMQLDQYIQQLPGGFRVAPIDVDVLHMTPLEKQRLSFIVQKLIRSLGEDKGGADARPAS